VNAVNVRKTLAAVILLATAVTGCDYIVPPPPEAGTPTPLALSDWVAVVLDVSDNNGALHVDLAIQNDTGFFSAMDTLTSKARVTAGGKTTDCGKVFVGTAPFVNDAGMEIPPGFIIKAYTAGTKAAPVVQPLFVECQGVAKTTGMTLQIDYQFIVGDFYYFVPSPVTNAKFNLNLDKVVSDQAFPVGATVENTIEPADHVIDAINHYTLVMTKVERLDNINTKASDPATPGFQFTWTTTNPTEYPGYVHIGTPPVVCSDGQIYGRYESPHLTAPPITPANDGTKDGTISWTTAQAVPADVTGCYVLLPTEIKQEKYFTFHVLDITDK
jgi:hypothetical protein